MSLITGEEIDHDEVRDWHAAATYDRVGRVTDQQRNQVLYVGVDEIEGIEEYENAVYVTAKISVDETVDYLLREKEDAMTGDYGFDDRVEYSGVFPAENAHDMASYYRMLSRGPFQCSGRFHPF